jgi:hypothetical protein
MEGDNNMNASNQAPVKEAPVGVVITSIVVLGILVLGGLYFLVNDKGSQMDGLNSYGSNSDEALMDTATIEAQSISDENASIESDLNSTDTINIDAGLNAS